MLTHIFASLFKRSTVGAVSLSLLLGLGLAVVPSSSDPAFAEDNFGPAEIGTASTSNVQPGKTPPTQPNGSSCAKDLPNKPTRVCGYASFGERYDIPVPNTFRRAVSGLPEPWANSAGQFQDNGYDGQCQGSWVPVYDPTEDPAVRANHDNSKPANTAYYSIGVWWVEDRNWARTTRREVVGYASVPRWKYELKRTKKTVFVPFAPYRLTYTITERIRVLNDPQKRSLLTTVDQINRKVSRSSPTTIYPGQTKPIIRVTQFPLWLSRTVQYRGCNYPTTPKLFTNVCATSVGPGYMTGPYGNPATTPWPVPTGVGKYDPQTELKKWNTRPANASSNPLWRNGPDGTGILYSNLGMAFLESPTFAYISGLAFPPAQPAELQYIKNCPDISYRVSARDQSCRYLGTTFPSDTGRLFPAGSEYCANFTPGNYYKNTNGYAARCQYAHVYWDPTPGGVSNVAGTQDRRAGNMEVLVNKYPQGNWAFREEFLGCDLPEPNPNSFRQGYSHWLCNDTAGANGENLTYNFANCSGPRRGGPPDVADTYRCVATNGGQPTIREVESGSVTGPITQALANGKQVQVEWPTPTGISVLSGGVLSRVQQPENMWQNWDIVSGSQPVNSDLPISDTNQSIFGSYLANVDPTSSGSVFGGPGKDEWDTPWLYLRAYKGAPINNTGSSVQVGTQNIAPEETLPLGVTMTFNSTVKKTVSTGLGGTLEINVPVTCKMPDAYVYYVAGRAID